MTKTMAQTKQYAASLGIVGVVEDGENAGGMVGMISPSGLPTALAALREDGYDVSDSRDDNGQVWVWWKPRA